jgi:hypothetical protein
MDWNMDMIKKMILYQLEKIVSREIKYLFSIHREILKVVLTWFVFSNFAPKANIFSGFWQIVLDNQRMVLYVIPI